MTKDGKILLPLHPAVGGSEKIGVQIFVGPLHIAHIRADAVQMSADVVESMVAQTMAAGFDHFKDIGMLANVVAHHEERGLHAVTVEDIEHPRGGFGDGAIVESEIHRAFRRIHPPQSVGIEPTEKKGGLFDDHARSNRLVFCSLLGILGQIALRIGGAARVHRRDQYTAGGSTCEDIGTLLIVLDER